MNQSSQTATCLLRFQAVQGITGESRTAFYEKIRNGLMPKPVKLGTRASAWPSNEIQAITAARIAGRSQAEIRALVARLEAERQAV